MTPAEAIALNSSGAPVFLAEIKLGNQYTFFTSTSAPYQTPDALNPYDVQQDGVSLTQVESIAEVNTYPNSWFNDGTNTYMNLSVNVYDWLNHSIQAFYQLNLCSVCEGTSLTNPRIMNVGDVVVDDFGNPVVDDFGNYVRSFDDFQYYQPRITSLPSLALKLEKKFSSIAEVGGGNIVLNNEDGFFDQFKSMQFDAGQTKIKFGYDIPGFTMDYFDYDSRATFWNSGIQFNETSFTLGLLELKTRLKVTIPLTFFNTTDFPNIENTGNGKPIPLAYGQIFGAPAICVDTTTKTFQVASHAIYSFDAVRIYDSNNNIWVDSSFITTSVSGATFTLGSDWTATQQVSVDFKGKKNSDGTFMNNASDIMADLLGQVGQSGSLDSASFASSKALLDLGFYLNTPPSNNRLVYLKPSFYINETQNVTDIINQMNAFVGAMLWVDPNGNYHYEVFDPQSRENLPAFDDTTLEDWTDQVEEVLNYTSVTTIHSQRLADNWGEFITYAVPPSKYIHKQPENVDAEPFIPTSDTDDATIYVQRFMIFNGRPSKVYTGDIVRADALLLNPGDQIHVYWNTDPVTGISEIDAVLDIIQITYNLEGTGGDNKNASVSVYCSDLRGWGDQPGFWTEDNPTIPQVFSTLAGYGTAAADPWNPNWHPIIKAYARQAFGWWTTDNGYADNTDPASWIPSCWI